MNFVVGELRTGIRAYDPEAFSAARHTAKRGTGGI